MSGLADEYELPEDPGDARRDRLGGGGGGGGGSRRSSPSSVTSMSAPCS